MEKPADLAAIVLLERLLLEAADAEHLAQEADFVVLGELRVDGRSSVVFGFDGSFHKAAAMAAE